MSSNQYNELKNLAREISAEYDKLSTQFSTFQNKNNLGCIEKCGRCCFKQDIYCSPIELLPMTIYLIENNKAYEYLEKIQKGLFNYCIFLNVSNESRFEGYCGEYEHRPVVCRTFGVSARHAKDGSVGFSICKTIKENKRLEVEKLNSLSLKKEDYPFINVSKSNLIALSPKFMDSEYTISESLRIMLEKVLLIKSYSLE